MPNIVGRSTIALELDDSAMQADFLAAEAIWTDFIRRMQAASGIAPTIDEDTFKNRVINFEVDPRTTKAGLAVINGIISEFKADMRREAHFTVGVNVTPVQTAMHRLNAFIRRSGQSMADGIYFWLSRGLLKGARDLAALPIEIMKESFGKFQTAEEATTKLAKALASTGESSGKSKQELMDYAKQLEKTTLVANEVTIGLQGILLASKGLTGDNFDRATRGALDLAAALGGEASTHAARLGKSLQDPVRGMEQLRDAGISFTQEQQDTIKFLVETNNLVDAQGILLDELESRYGGAANTTGELNDKIREQALNYENLQEKIGEVVAEQADSFIPAMAAGIESFEIMAPAVLGTATVLAELGIELAKTMFGIDGVTDSTEDLIQKTDEWIASIKAGAAYLDESFDVDPIMDELDKLMIYLGVSGTPKDHEFYGMDMNERYAKRYNDEIAARKKARKDRKDQAELDAKQAKEDWKKEQEARGLGQGKLSKAAQDAVQQAKDAKDAIQRNKDEQAQKRREEADYARQDAEEARDHAKKLRDAKKAEADAAAAAKRAEREAARALAKEESEEKKLLIEEDKKLAKEKADYEKSMGRDGLVAMHDRIQDARFLRREEEKDKRSVEERARDNVAKRRKDKEESALTSKKDEKGRGRGLEMNPRNSLGIDTDKDKVTQKMLADAQEAMFATQRGVKPGAFRPSDEYYEAQEKRDELRKKFKKQNPGLGDNSIKSINDAATQAAKKADEERQRQEDLAKMYMPGMGSRNSLGRLSPREAEDKRRNAELEKMYGPTRGSKLEVKQDEVVKAIRDQTTAVVTAVGQPGVLGK